ncbi:AKL13 protein, partial [Puccinia sorghi]
LTIYYLNHNRRSGNDSSTKIKEPENDESQWDPEPVLPDDAPERVFLMQEYIPCYQGLLSYFIPIKPALKMLHAFQHFGNPSLITNTKFLGLIPRQGVDVKTNLSKFIKDHYFTDVCESLHLFELFEIPWMPVSKESTSVSPSQS